MASPRRKWIAVTVTAIAAASGVVATAVVLAPAGCADNCATNCPTGTVYIGNTNNHQLAIEAIGVQGPACPPQYGVYCIGDGNQTTNCTHVTITGYAHGTCDVVIAFADRPSELIHTEFGPPIKQGCCKGYTIVGDSVFIIPDNPDAAISGVDGASDQVSILVDGGATDGGDGGTNDAGSD